MTRVALMLIVIAFVAKAHSQQQALPQLQFDMNDFMAHQQQHQHQMQMHDHQREAFDQHQQHMQMHEQQHMQMHDQQREAFEMGAGEPVVGSPLLPLKIAAAPLHMAALPLKLKMATAPFALHHALNPLGVPGLRFSNFNAGHFGGMPFSSSILGSENPNAAGDDEQVMKKHHHHHIEDSSQLSMGPPSAGEHQHGTFDSDLSLAPQQQDQGIFHWHHWVNDEQQLGAEQMPPQLQHFAQGPPHVFPEQNIQPMPMQPEQFQVSAPQHAHQHMEMQPQIMHMPAQPQMVGARHIEMRPVGPSVQHFEMGANGLPIFRNAMEDGSRTWGKKGKGYSYGNDYDSGYGGNDKGYGGYDSGYGNQKGHSHHHHHDKGYSKGYDKGYNKGGYSKGGYGQEQYSKGYNQGGYSKGGYGQEQYGKGYSQGGYSQGGYSSGGGTYNSYGGGSYGGYRTNEQIPAQDGMTVGAQSNPAAPKTEVGQLITSTTEATTSTTTAISTVQPTPCEIPKKSDKEKSEESTSGEIKSTTVKSKSTKATTSKPKSRSRRSTMHFPAQGRKRCIEKLFGGSFVRSPILGAGNPFAEEPSKDCDSAEESCGRHHQEAVRLEPVRFLQPAPTTQRTTTEPPLPPTTEPTLQAPHRHQQTVMQRMTQPYMGMYNKKMWNHRGVMGRIMAPIEDIYFEFLPNDEMVQMINMNQQDRLIT